MVLFELGHQMSVLVIRYNQLRTLFRTTVSKLPSDYTQGQSSSPKIREYFYYVDHHGQLFLDDARMKNFTSCFKDKDFLVFFYSRLRANGTGRYEEFPYLSLCGRERNFVRCDDRPIVYTHIFEKKNETGTAQEFLAYGNAGDRLAVLLEPENFCMSPENGRVYYPATVELGGVGLVRSALAMELSPCFRFGDGQAKPPSHIIWKGREYKLKNDLWSLLQKS